MNEIIIPTDEEILSKIDGQKKGRRLVRIATAAGEKGLCLRNLPPSPTSAMCCFRLPYSGALASRQRKPAVEVLTGDGHVAAEAQLAG